MIPKVLSTPSSVFFHDELNTAALQIKMWRGLFKMGNETKTLFLETCIWRAFGFLFKKRYIIYYYSHHCNKQKNLAKLRNLQYPCNLWGGHLIITAKILVNFVEYSGSHSQCMAKTSDMRSKLCSFSGAIFCLEY